MRKRPEKIRRTGAPGQHRKTIETFSFHEADDRLYSYLSHHGFEDYPHEKRQKLTQFYLLLMQEQNRQNITRLLTLRDVAIKHFVDCLMVPRLVKFQYPLLDIGTGAGFPGIPLKVDLPESHIILSEGVQKRVEFLKKIRTELKLSKLDIIGRNISPVFVYPIRGAITRAVEDIGQTLASVNNALQLGGEVYFMKGPNLGREIENALEKYGEFYELSMNKHYVLPDTPHERRLVVFKKIKHPEPISLEKIIDEDFTGDDD